MKRSTWLVLSILSSFFFIIVASPLLAGVFWPDKWWPSKWGPDDEKGSFNTITPKKIMSSLKVVKTGKVYRLGRPYTNDMPKFGNRTYSLHIPGNPVGGPVGNNNIVWNDEFIVGELGQVGTQFDGPGHVGIRGKDGVDRWYNGRELAKSENTYGFKQNGVEKLGPCITRGVLIDVAGLKGVDFLKKGEVIKPKDIEDCLKKAGVAPIQEGDAVIFHTGWGKHWKNPAIYNEGCPGIGLEAAKYFINKNVSLLAADTWPIEAIPGEDPNGAFDIHNLMQTVHGIWFLENLDNKVMEQMIKDKVYEFLFIFVPVPFAGATGSPGDAIAIQ
ncbi:MAG: cyclase family protein [Thermodesulfobacteriota bacterium]